MSPGARLVALGLAAALAIGALALYVLDRVNSGPIVYMLGLQASLVLIGTLFEARYRGRKSVAGAQWQVTGERELDYETGTLLEVWYDPVTGERRYVPAGQLPG